MVTSNTSHEDIKKMLEDSVELPNKSSGLEAAKPFEFDDVNIQRPLHSSKHSSYESKLSVKIRDEPPIEEEEEEILDKSENKKSDKALDETKSREEQETDYIPQLPIKRGSCKESLILSKVRLSTSPRQTTVAALDEVPKEVPSGTSKYLMVLRLIIIDRVCQRITEAAVEGKLPVSIKQMMADKASQSMDIQPSWISDAKIVVIQLRDTSDDLILSLTNSGYGCESYWTEFLETCRTAIDHREKINSLAIVNALNLIEPCSTFHILHKSFAGTFIHLHDNEKDDYYVLDIIAYLGALSVMGALVTAEFTSAKHTETYINHTVNYLSKTAAFKKITNDSSLEAFIESYASNMASNIDAMDNLESDSFPFKFKNHIIAILVVVGTLTLALLIYKR